jgi:hypothetical protein
VLFCCGALGRYWHKEDITVAKIRPFLIPTGSDNFRLQLLPIAKFSIKYRRRIQRE